MRTSFSFITYWYAKVPLCIKR